MLQLEEAETAIRPLGTPFMKFRVNTCGFGNDPGEEENEKVRDDGECVAIGSPDIRTLTGMVSAGVVAPGSDNRMDPVCGPRPNPAVLAVTVNKPVPPP